MLVPIRSPSSSTPGMVAALEPVAMRIRSASRVTGASPETWTLPGAAIRAVPRTRVIPFFLKRKSMPLVSWVTIFFLRFIMAARSSSTPETFTPWAAKLFVASRYFSLDSRRALEGMQPTLRQVPPRGFSFSMQATLRPSWLARMAAT